MSLQTGVVPALFKTAIITPRLKTPGTDINTAQSNRPISNMLFLSNCLSTSSEVKYSHFIDFHLLLSHCQTAYRSGFSTETALVKVYSDVITTLDSNTDRRYDCSVWHLSHRLTLSITASSCNACNDHMEYLVTRWHGSHLTWLPGNSVFGLEINSPPAVMFLTGFRKDPSRTTSVYSVRIRCSQNSRETRSRFTFLCRRRPAVPYLSSWWLCHMCQSRLHLHRRNWPVDGGKSFGNESGKDRCLMVSHKWPTIWFTAYTSGRYSSTFLLHAQSQHGVRQWLVTEGSCQSTESQLLQLFTSHQELPTCVHPDPVATTP